jgi:hypothetical protein
MQQDNVTVLQRVIHSTSELQDDSNSNSNKQINATPGVSSIGAGAGVYQALT